MTQDSEAQAVLRVADLRVEFPGRSRPLAALDGLHLEIRYGERVGLVGESGSGKSIAALSILRLVPFPGEIKAGTITLLGRDVLAASAREMRTIRRTQIGIIFQDPVGHLDPTARVGRWMAEVISARRGISASAARTVSLDLLRLLHVPSPERVLSAYPFELSGGMCQRVLIAAAIAQDPPLLIADEATSALDVTVQAHILRALVEVSERRDAGMLITTHNVQVVRRACSSVAVMYAGRIVEKGETEATLSLPLHPYTRGLLASVPSVAGERIPLASIPGEPPTAGDVTPGCSFYARCPIRRSVCQDARPPLREVQPGRWSACFFAEDLVA